MGNHSIFGYIVSCCCSVVIVIVIIDISYVLVILIGSYQIKCTLMGHSYLIVSHKLYSRKKTENLAKLFRHTEYGPLIQSLWSYVVVLHFLVLFSRRGKGDLNNLKG
jgi:hypothetical protein